MSTPIGSGAWYFLAFPDNDAATPVAARALPWADMVVEHPSGRPWLVGRQPNTRVLVHREGPNRLALVGSTSATDTELARMSDTARSVGDLTEVSARFAGNFCVVGSLAGRVYAQGSAVGVRRVCHAEVDGVRVVSDRADVLAELGGLPVDETALALRLARSLPHPLPETPLWSGLHPVAPTDYVTVDRDGLSPGSGTWWHRPEPQLSRAEGAQRLRDALERAVHARTASGERVSCDLSGGLDSTPLCYFAAHGPDGVLARTMYNNDPGGLQDLEWAYRALPSMPGVREHVVESTDQMPGFFGGLLEMDARLEEPGQAAMAGPRISYGLSDDAARGITTRLSGLSGDHLLRGLKTWEHSLFRTRPLLAWRRARALDAPENIPVHTTLRELLDRSTYRAWLQRSLTATLDGIPPPDLPRISDWSLPVALPPWLSADARDAVIAKLREAARSAYPLGQDRATHAEMSLLRNGAQTARSANQLGPQFGVAFEAPLLDDHITEAVLTVRREERDSPVEWKPLIKEAMKSLLPQEYLRRTTKIGGSAQAVRGFASHQEDIRRLCDSSGLPELGLIDMDRLAEATRPDPTAMPSAHIFEVINMAVFLRNQAHHRALDTSEDDMSGSR